MPSNPDDIDSETLQAQIDMSISFAHNLVTSWIQTGQAARSHSSTTDTEHILREQLRRPPRLGVGAPVPASISANQDASKLRHRLTKTGRNTTSSSEIPLRSDAKSEEEEEEKGKLKKRLMKLDPFERKKRRKIEIPPKIPISKINGHIQGINGKDRKEVLKPKISKEKASHDKRPATPAKTTTTNATLECLPQQSDSPSSSKAVRICTQDNDGTSVDVASLAVPALKSSMTPYIQRLGDSPSLPRVSGQHSAATKQANVSLLNLDGPPEASEQVGNSDSPNISKKQRKRRKKKKRTIGTGTGTETT